MVIQAVCISLKGTALLQPGREDVGVNVEKSCFCSRPSNKHDVMLPKGNQGGPIMP